MIDRDAFIRAWQKHRDSLAVAEVLGCTRASVNGIHARMKKKGVPLLPRLPRRPPPDRVDWARLRALAESLR